MKISCEREKFSQPFQLAASVAASKDIKPVLRNVKITITKKGVLLQATDTEIGIRLNMDGCENLEKGEAILPAKQIKDILQESGSESTFLIESEKEKVLVSMGKDRFTFPTQPTDEFPDVEDFNESAYHEVSVKVLREVIRRTTFAIDTESNRYSLGGVLLEFVEGKICGVGTDGRRLAFQEGVAECIGDHKAEGTIFPAKALQILDRALGEDDGTVQVSVSSNRALFRCGNVVFFTRLIEGRFPAWRRIIPETEGKTQIDILAGALNSAVRKAAIVTKREPGVIFSFSAGKLVLHGQGGELGESNIEVPIAYSGADQQVKLNPDFFTDYLRVLEGDKNLSIYIESDGDPIHIRTDDNYIYVVMPMS